MKGLSKQLFIALFMCVLGVHSSNLTDHRADGHLKEEDGQIIGQLFLEIRSWGCSSHRAWSVAWEIIMGYPEPAHENGWGSCLFQ